MQRKFIEAVATNLKINLTVIPIGDEYNSRFHFPVLVKNHITGDNRPDYIITPFPLKSEVQLFELIEQYKIPVFTINNTISDKTYTDIGKPREKFKYWLGHMSPNDYQAGKDLAVHLSKLSDHKSPLVLGISGATDSAAAKNRENGLISAEQQEQFDLLPIIHTDWTKESGKKAVEHALKYFKNVNIIWTAGPGTAIGAVKKLGYDKQSSDDRPIKIGTFDWSIDGFKLIDNNQIDITYGGHFMEAGWALILVLDHANKVDFSESMGVTMTTKLTAVTKDNLSVHQSFIKSNDWSRIDFSALSRCTNPQNKSYNFDIESLLEAVNSPSHPK
jgi:ABC-type sugar transport system substrate-binding protein